MHNLRRSLADFLGERLDRFTEEQRTAITSREGPIALTAAAGSGKTSVLVERYLVYLSRGLTPQEILLLTFTNEAADQMRRRLLLTLEEWNPESPLIGQVESSPYIGTLHSFCYSVINQFGSTLDLPAIQTIPSAFQFAALFDDCYSAWIKGLDSSQIEFLLDRFPYREIRPLAKRLFQSERTLLSTLALASRPEQAWLTQLLSMFSPLLRSLEAKFRLQGWYRFDDLETSALDILTRSEETRNRLSTQFKAVCVDEFQDTSEIQWDLLKPLISKTPRTLFTVGDPKQSIYRFRNADVKVFAKACEQIIAWNGLSLQLTQNFRSAPVLINSINHMAKDFFAGGAIPFVPMVPSRKTLEESKFEILSYEGEKGDWANSESNTVVRYLQDRIAQGWKPEEIALLFRVAERIPLYVERLEAAGIHSSAKRTLDLFSRYEVRDFHHYLRALHEPNNDFWLSGLLRSPYVGWSYQRLWEATNAGGQTLFDKAKSFASQELSWLIRLCETKDCPLALAIESLTRATRASALLSPALFEVLHALFPDTGEALTVSQAVSRLETWEREGISLSSAHSQDKSGRVQLMTVHGAKGLEFPHVCLVDNIRQSPRRYPPLLLKPGEPPGLRYLEGEEYFENEVYQKLSEENAGEDSEESKRILYVALTRARDTLTIFVPKEKKGLAKDSWASWIGNFNLT